MLIFGLNLSVAEHEQLMDEFIDQKWHKEEQELFKTKWFDYRKMHPVRATYVFAAYYKLAYNKMMQRRKDVNNGSVGVRGKLGDVFTETDKATRQGFWKARQNADRHGIPYGFYVRAAMRWADRRNQKYLLRPMHLYGEEITEYLIELWQRRSVDETI